MNIKEQKPLSHQPSHTHSKTSNPSLTLKYSYSFITPFSLGLVGFSPSLPAPAATKISMKINLSCCGQKIQIRRYFNEY